jgi:hypothetical protein
VKLRLGVPAALRRPRRRQRPREQAPREIVPRPAPADPFDAARERLKREISPPDD